MKKLLVLLVMMTLPLFSFAIDKTDYYIEFFVGNTGDSLYNSGTVGFTCYDNGGSIWEGIGITLSYPFMTVSPPAIISLDVPFRFAATSDFLITLTPSVFGVIGYYPLNTVGLSAGLGIAIYNPSQMPEIGISTLLGYRYYNAYFPDTWFISIGLVIRF